MSGPPEDRQIINAMTGQPASPDIDPIPSSPIELEPLDLEPAPQRNVGQFPDARTNSFDGVYTIPEKPLHLCPTCDYNLTGLTSRRCPECGEAFDLHEARLRGFESSELMRSFRLRALLGRTRVVIGFVLMVLACVGANSLRLNGFLGPTFTPIYRVTLPGLLLAIFTGSLLLVTTLSKHYFELEWANLILGVGVAVFLLSLLFII